MKKKINLVSQTPEGHKLGVFSFFSGAGLLDFAFEDSGFETLAMNELSESFTKAYFYSRERLGRQLPTIGAGLAHTRCTQYGGSLSGSR